jgi:hypothetical protein
MVDMEIGRILDVHFSFPRLLLGAYQESATSDIGSQIAIIAQHLKKVKLHGDLTTRNKLGLAEGKSNNATD